MASADLIFNGNTTTIQFNENDKIEKILNKFCIKIEKNINELYFLYNGHIIEANKTFKEVANSEDKQRKKISILVTDNKSTIYPNKDSNLKKSKYIICPICNDTTRINIQNFKIKLYGCKNGHIIDDLSFSDFNHNQIIDESKIICDICKKINKAKTYNNSFFKCFTCKKNLCPLCNSSHEKNHIRVEYDQQYFKCNIHNEKYSLYCKQCNKNICILCEKEHKTHDKISLGELIPDINKLNEDKNNLRKSLDEFKSNIKEIINNLNNVIRNIESYYNIYSDIISEFDIQKRNYQILQNLNDMNEYNNDFIKEINNIINDDNICSKFVNITKIYNKLYLKKEDENFNK